MLRDIFLEYYGGTVFLTDEFKTSECPSFHHSSIVLVVSLLKEQAYNVNKVSKFITEKHIKEDLFSVFFLGGSNFNFNNKTLHYKLTLQKYIKEIA